jgi:hypothetical protein
MEVVFATRGTNRHSFCKQYGYKPNTLQNYWGTNKLPPGNMVADLCEYVEESADYLLYGKKKQLKTPSEREATKEMIDLLTEEDHITIVRIIKSFLRDHIENRENTETTSK